MLPVFRERRYAFLTFQERQNILFTSVLADTDAARSTLWHCCYGREGLSRGDSLLTIDYQKSYSRGIFDRGRSEM